MVPAPADEALLPDLLRLVLLAEDVTQVGIDVEALVVAWHAWNN